MPTLRIWINAFIPRDVPNYTRSLTTGPHSGKTAIPMPALGSLNPVNLWKEIGNAFDTGYLSDQRTFSDTPTASVRMRSWLELEVPAMNVLGQGHESTGTTEVDLKNGKQLGFAVADMSRCKWTFPTNTTAATHSPRLPSPVVPGSGALPNPLRVELEAAAGDPLVSAAADIDYEGTFTITATGGMVSVEFDLKIDSFPAFEAYASLNGSAKALFIEPPPAGNTVSNLPGKANRPKSGKVTLP